MTVATASQLVLGRQLRPLARDPFVLLFGVLQPIVFLALYGPLLASMPGTGGTSTWQWFVPGIIVMVSLFGTSVAGWYLLEEIRVGAFERFLVTPLDRHSLLIGRALKEVVPLTLQALLIVLIVTPFGFQLHPRRDRRRAPDPRGVRCRPGRAVVLAGDGGPPPGVPVLARPADAAVPAAPPVGDPAADGARAGLAPGPVAAQPADLPRRSRAGAVRRRSRESFGGDRRRRGPRVAVVGLSIGTRMMRRAAA